MMAEDLTLEDIRRMAADAGMTRLSDAHLHELLRSATAARARRTSLRTGSLTPADEPAHVFRLPPGDAP